MVKSRNATAEELKNSLWSRWIAYFGRPRIFQVNPEGAWMSNTIRENLESSSIQRGPIPRQAHWQIGGIERLICLIKDLLTTLARECPGKSCEEYLARAVVAYNEFDRHRVFSPLQVALGRAPDLDGSFMDAPGDPVNLPALESEAVDAEFGENFKFMRQLRDASDREVAEHEITHGTELPWTFNSMTQGLRAGQYEDLADDPRLIPSDTEFVDAGGDHYGLERSDRQKRRDQIDQQGLTAEIQPFACSWNREDNAIEVEISLPERARGGSAARDLSPFVATQLRRQRAEVRERTLSAADLEKFRKARTREAQERIKEMVLEGLPSHASAPSDRLMRLRWVLTWKVDPAEPGGRRAKARSVILGFQDPDLTTQESHAPTATRTARQVSLQKAANLKMRVAGGDVKSAFLQGEELDRELFVKPTGEIVEMLGLRSGQAAILKKSAYGLVQAPRAWHQAMNRKLKELGWRQLESDPCVWILTSPSTTGRPDDIVAIALSRVDDFSFAGREADKTWQQARRQVTGAFRWTEWEYNTFTQCGVDVTQRADFGFTPSQAAYTEQIEEIEVPAERRRQLSSPVTVAEKTQFRAATGSLQWKGTQTGPNILAELSLLQSKTESCTVDDLVKVNKLIKRAKETKGRMLEISPFAECELAVVGWGDAAFGNRVDGKSTEGRVLGIVPVSFLAGEETGVSLISWRSGKVERTCRSPPSAEVSATVNTEDEVTYVRFLLAELSGWKPDLRDPWAQVRKVQECLITDSKNLYDRLRCPEKRMGGKEFRTGLELLALRDGIVACGCPVRWVHTGAMLANSLTKDHERWKL
ncbi:unnamed protein product [Prorocentrum cordatum]|uniref:Reverse transcriptase Ty1/copia-type domain-containing protein n=1 Tax=Prorocentrum cordatum TaxID=2364126 RepID=A0ABN9XTH3_9DINO|nr:unnamed protein product [Polarella glacialis]